MNYVGRSIPSLTNAELASGRGTFVGDIMPAQGAFVSLLRSPHPRATILGIDKESAERVAGVLAVLAGEDVNGELGPLPLTYTPERVGVPRLSVFALANRAVRYAGEPVAAVVAEDLETANGALTAIDVKWEVLDPVLDRDAALAPGAPTVEPGLPGNLLVEQLLETGDLDGAFANADGVVQGEITAARIMGAPLEPRGVVAAWDEVTGRLTCWASTQSPHPLRDYIASALGLAVNDVRVIQPRVGGAFGAKLPVMPEEILIPYLARRLRRPVRWIESRRENLVASGHSRDTRCRYRAAYQADGRVTALEAELVGDVGAGSATNGWTMITKTHLCIPGPYKIENLRVRTKGVLTNRTPWQAYRGMGKEAAALFLDRIMDHVARASGVERHEVRLRNFIPTADMPSPQPSGAVIDSGDYEACLCKLLELIDLPRFREEQERARASGRLLGVGLGQELTPEGSAAVNTLMSGVEGAHLRVAASGDVTLFTGVTSPGTGNETGLAQIVADGLGCAIESVRIVQGDTDLCPQGSGNFSSRAVTSGGGAVALAAGELRAKLTAVAASMLEAAEADVLIERGRVWVAGSPDAGLPLSAVTTEVHLNPHGAHMNGLEPGLETIRYKRIENVFHQPETQGRYSTYPNWSNASAACVVEVDEDTGVVKVLRYILVHDAGTIINPLLAEAQLQGAVIQGLGSALYEFVAFDDRGHPLSESFMHYTIPSAKEAIQVEFAHHVSPSPFTHLGAKGVGESGLSAPAGAIAGAIEDALSGLNVQLGGPPYTPSRVWHAIQAARPI